MATSTGGAGTGGIATSTGGAGTGGADPCTSGTAAVDHCRLQ